MHWGHSTQVIIVAPYMDVSNFCIQQHVRIFVVAPAPHSCQQAAIMAVEVHNSYTTVNLVDNIRTTPTISASRTIEDVVLSLYLF